MSFSIPYNLRLDQARMSDVADAIDALGGNVQGRKTETVTGSELSTSSGIVFINNTTNITRTLPAPTSVPGKTFLYVKISNNTNTCTISTPSGSIFGAMSNVLSARAHYVAVLSDGTNWQQVGGNVLNWQTWTPTYIPSGSMTFTSVTTSIAQYAIDDRFVHVRMRFSGTIATLPEGTLGSVLGVSTPIDPNVGEFGLETSMLCRITNTGSRMGIAVSQGAVTPRRFDISRFDFANFTAGAFSCSLNGYYLI
jgi:hypothetical protein